METIARYKCKNGSWNRKLFPEKTKWAKGSIPEGLVGHYNQCDEL